MINRWVKIKKIIKKYKKKLIFFIILNYFIFDIWNGINFSNKKKKKKKLSPMYKKLTPSNISLKVKESIFFLY